MTRHGELSAALGGYAAKVRLQDLAPADMAHLGDAFVNWVGCAAGGVRAASVEAAAKAYRAMTPDGRQPTIGRQERYGLVEAISLDCLASAALAFDDTHLDTVLHPTGPVAAALLGEARLRKVSGADFLLALHVGMEVQCRIGLAFVSPATGAKRGWYATGIAGGVGAAAGLGRLLGFDASQIASTMGLAAARASGNRGTHGSMAAAYVPAMAAESGFIAAKLTEAGLTCGARALDGSDGMIDLITEAPALERALDQLGRVSEAARTAFKPYPSGIVTHPIIDACLALVREHGIAAADIEAIHFDISRTAAALVARKHPKDQLEAQISLYFWAAAVLTMGSAGIEQTDDRLIGDPAISALQDRMSAATDDALADDQCRAKVCLADGRSIDVSIEHAVGSISRPMSSAQIDAKFLGLALVSYPRERAEGLLRLCRGLLQLDDVRQVLDA